MRIVYSGSGAFGIFCLDALFRSHHELNLVITSPAKGAGRGRRSTATAVGRWANAHEVVCLETANVNEAGSVEQIGLVKPDLMVVIAFGQYIGRELMDLPAYGCINVHASLLPSYRGAAPINHAIINGERETGISIIRLAAKVDAGDILGQCRTSIGEDETADELHDRLAELSVPLLMKTIDGFEGVGVEAIEQDETQATYAPRLKKSDGFIDFLEPAELLKRKILGFWPWPGATVEYHGQAKRKPERLSLARAEVVKRTYSGAIEPGMLDVDLNVVCGRDSLRILELKPAGGSLMSFDSFVNGRCTKAGDRFVKVSE